MKLNSDLYFKKNLIYGLGVSGRSCFNHLKKIIIKCFDDNPKIWLKNSKNYIISKKN